MVSVWLLGVLLYMHILLRTPAKCKIQYLRRLMNSHYQEAQNLINNRTKHIRNSHYKLQLILWLLKDSLHNLS